jgi:1-deoxy-D-xylulose-5-phosphate reductoisomerase
MGRKISVDSATLMNKGLEVIEAHWLFGLEADRIEVVVHPQSIVHSLVAYLDGSVLAQLGNPDMRTAIACALAWPERLDAGVAPLDLLSVANLSFESPDRELFPCLGLAYAALAAGGTAPAILNAANEIAVGAFLHNKIGFLDMTSVVEKTMQHTAFIEEPTLEEYFESDGEARNFAASLIKM